MTIPAADGTGSEAALERSIGRILTIGTWISIGLLAVGFVLLVVNGLGPRSADPGFDLTRLPRDLVGLRPEGAIWLGLVLVIGTPAARVAAALVGYARRGERAMTVVAVLILLVIAASVVIARVTEG